MHPSSTPCFQGVEKWCIGNEWVNQYQQLLHSFYQINWMAIIQGGNWLDENFPGGNLLCGNYPGANFPVGVFLCGNYPGGNFPGGSFPGWELSGWEVSGWEFS